MRKIIQWIVGGAILVYGVRMWNSGFGPRVALAVIVVGVLVILNTGGKKKKAEEDEGW